MRHGMGRTLIATDLKVSTATGTKIDIIGMAECHMQLGKAKYQQAIHVSKSISSNTLGSDF
jgi:hypothetical protein